MSADFKRIQSRLHEAKRSPDVNATVDAITDILTELIKHLAEKERAPLFKDSPLSSEPPPLTYPKRTEASGAFKQPTKRPGSQKWAS